MQAFIFSDLHANFKQLDNFKRFFEKRKDIDLIIFAGDVVNMAEPVAFANKFVEIVKEIDLPFFWVPGNNDFGRAYFKLKAAFPSLEGKIMEFDGRTFTGVGGSPASWSGQYAGESMIDKQKIGGSIFVSHVPPPGAVHYEKNPKQVSDFEFRASNLQLADSPLVHICGHIHHTWGVAYLGQTKVVKLATAELGHYGILDLETLEVTFERF